MARNYATKTRTEEFHGLGNNYLARCGHLNQVWSFESGMLQNFD